MRNAEYVDQPMSIESTMARYQLIRVPQFILGAATLSAVAFIIILV